MLAEKKFELEATQIALRQAEEKLKNIPILEDFPDFEGKRHASDHHHAQHIINHHEKRHSEVQIEIQREGLHSRGRLEKRLSQRRMSRNTSIEPRKSNRNSLPNIREESPLEKSNLRNGHKNEKLAEPTEKRGNAEIFVVGNTEKRESIIRDSATDDSNSLRHHPKQPPRPRRRSGTAIFKPDQVLTEPAKSKKKKKRKLTKELKTFSKSMRSESFRNRAAAKRVIERSRKELARANTILQAEKHRDHNKLMERVKRRNLSTAHTRRNLSLSSLSLSPARKNALDRPTTSVS